MDASIQLGSAIASMRTIAEIKQNPHLNSSVPELQVTCLLTVKSYIQSLSEMVN
jgi:hypothetical protein